MLKYSTDYFTKGWLVVERSRNAKDVRNVRGNFGDNVAYLKEVFN